jgi:hypothetical protein
VVYPSAKFFPEPFLHRRHQPVMSLVGVDQDHQTEEVSPSNGRRDATT